MSRQSRFVMLVSGLMVVLFGLFAWSQASASDDVDLAATRAGILSFTDAVDSLATQPQLTAVVPLTGLNPVGSDGLGLSDLVRHAFDPLTSASLDTPSALQSALEGLDGPVGDVAVTVGTGCPSCTTAVSVTDAGGFITAVVPFHAERTTPVPLRLSSGPVRLNGGQLSAKIVLNTSMTFRFEKALRLSAPAQAFSVTNAPSVQLTTTLSTPTPLSFTANVGLSDVNVGGSIASASAGVTANFADPDGLNGITLDEFTTTAIADLAPPTVSGSIDASVTLDSTLNGVGTDATVAINDPDLSNGFQGPTITAGSLGSLASFTNLSPESLINGLAGFASSLQSLQIAGDQKLPFIQESVAKAAELAKPVLDVVQRQTVICGAVPGVGANPPTGDVSALVSGDPVYCRAAAAGTPEATHVVWSIANGNLGANTTGAAADGTVGATTSKDAVFAMTSDGSPDVSVAYKIKSNPADPASPVVDSSATRPVRTAQALLAQLKTLAGFDASSITSFDSTTRALTFNLTKSFDVPSYDGGFDFGDQLKTSTKLFGLSPSSTATLTVDAGTATIHLTFGVLLTDTTAQITPEDSTDTGEANRFFLQVDPSAPELSLDNATITGSVHLAGRLGFLEVTADGDDSANTDPTRTGAFTVGKVIGDSSPLLQVNVAGGSVTVDPGTPATISNAILLPKLAGTLSTAVSKSVNIGMSGGLTVTAKTGGTPGTTLGTGKIALSWPNITVGTPTATVDTDFTNALQVFDSFDASNPQALLSLILDNLDGIVGGLSSLSGTAFDTSLPLVGTSPRALFAQLQTLRQSINELRGSVAGTIACGTGAGSATVAPSGDPTSIAPAQSIFCRATTNKAIIGTPTWAVDAGTPVDGATTATTAGTATTPPSTNFEVKPTATSARSLANPAGYLVTMTFTDSDGTHTLNFPETGPPQTLQKLETAIEQKLGLPATAFGLETIEIPPASGNKYLAVRLGDNVCSTGMSGCSTDPSTGTDRSVAPLSAPLNLGVGSNSIVGVGAKANVNINYLARAHLDLAIPLSGSDHTPQVLDTTGLQAAATISSTNVDVTANLGPLALDVGINGGGSDPAGVFNLGAGFSLTKTDPDGTPNTNTYPVSTYPSSLAIALQRPAATVDCGSVDPDNPLDTDSTDDPSVPLDGGDACARLSLKLGSTYLGDVGVKIGDITNPGGTTSFSAPEALAQQIAAAVLDWRFLLGALPKLLERLQTSLDGSAQSVKLPIVGDALDAGADVVGKVKGVADQLNTIGDQIQAEITANTDTDGDGSPATPKDVEKKIHDLLMPVVTGAGLLIDTQAPAGVDDGDLRVVLSCGGTPCLATDALTDIDDARVTMMLGQGDSPTEGCTATCVAGATLPFDIGLDGLPLRITGSVQAHVGWRALVDVGLSRSDGPYLVVGGSGHDFGQAAGDPEVSVGASVGLGNSGCSPDDPIATGVSGFSEQRCLQGTLGFLFVNARDGDTPSDQDKKKSEISLLASLQLAKNGGGSRLTFGDLTSGQASASLGLTGDANVDLRIRTGLRGGETAGFPSILGTFHAGFSFGGSTAGGFATGGNPNATPSELRFADLSLDVGSFIQKTVGPLLKDVKNITSPLKPIIDTLQAPLPVVSDLSHLVGGDDITLLSLLEAASGSKLDVVKSVIQLINFVNTISSVADSRVLPLGGGGTGESRDPGSFSVVPAAAKGSPLTPDQAGTLISSTGKNAGTGIINDVNGASVGTVGSGSETRAKTFGVEGLAFPFLQDASNIFSVLMGSDVDLVTYDAGPLSAKAGLSYDFGPFFIGPVPVTVGIFGSAEIKGRFKIGYDTSGLRRVLSGASGEHLLDGVKIFDLDAAGNDVPEIQLIGEVGARAAVDLVVISAGVEGGIRLTLNLNLNDSPNKDGVLRIDEILEKLQNPICLFDVSGALDFFLRAFVEIDLFFYSDRFEFELLNIRLLDFSASCEPPKPVLAVNDGSGTLTLNIGTRANQRGIQEGETNEKFEVRAMGGGSYSVKAFGKTQEFGPVAGQHAISTIVGDGAGGSDQILMQPGGTTSTSDTSATGLNPPDAIPFTAAAHLNGGDDDDVLVGGSADDTLSGGGGNDQILAGDGADTVTGGDGNDAIDGQGGDDPSLSGGNNNDRINGGAGADRILGGSGDDTLTGGPGTDPAVASNPAAGHDGDDTIVGGSGNDTASGSFGSDHIYGDAEVGCTGISFSSGLDSLDGGPGDDFLYGGPSEDSLIGKGGNDLLCGNGGDDRLDGDGPAEAGLVPGDDTLQGGSGRDYLLGRAGDDGLDGGTENDYLDAGDGRDDLIGGLGVDYLVGGQGADIEVGDNGVIAAHAPADHDSLSQADRAALVTPAAGASSGTVIADCGAILENATKVSATPTGNGDCVYGGVGNDVLYGERGDDRVYGDDGNDYVSGDDGNDYLRGGLLADLMLGGNANDEMYGDSGDDRMFGNADQDL
ncbi:MAG: hypothetical protein QOE64_2471, partial [Frankiales bacterium]|nr:hypothetical protein [Frankiales bacterium]